MAYLYWRVEPRETGPGRTLRLRGWPMAFLRTNELPAFRVQCETPYTQAAALSGRHAPLRLLYADYSQHAISGFTWRRFVKPFATMQEVKSFAESYVHRHPEKFKQGSALV